MSSYVQTKEKNRGYVYDVINIVPHDVTSQHELLTLKKSILS